VIEQDTPSTTLGDCSVRSVRKEYCRLDDGMTPSVTETGCSEAEENDLVPADRMPGRRMSPGRAPDPAAESELLPAAGGEMGAATRIGQAPCGAGAGLVPGEEAPARAGSPQVGPWSRWRSGLRGAKILVTRNLIFSIALGLAVILRAMVMAGFQPAVLVGLDSYIYLKPTVRGLPDPDNPDGYPFFLWLLKPFHSLALVAGLQHLMGLGIAVLAYALLRRYGVRGWVATLAAAPMLFDPRELVVEHAIMADTLATLLMVSAFVALLGRRPVGIWRSAAAGLLMGVAAIVRPTALVLIVVVISYPLFTRQGWRRATAVLSGGILPIAGYAAWFYAGYGVLNLTNSNGLFLWARTMSFANCAVIKPPPSLVPLCPIRNPRAKWKARPDPFSWHTLRNQETPQDYLWRRSDWPWQPQPAGYEPYYVAFTPANNARAQRFALRAIAAQPRAYAAVVAEGIALTFQATDHDWRFPTAQPETRNWTPDSRQYAVAAVREYAGNTAGLAGQLGTLTTRRAPPWATIITSYQRVVYLPGAVLAVIFAIGLAGIVTRRRRTAPAVLLWISAVIVLVFPVAENQYNYRYALPAVPLACMAAALVAGAHRRDRRASRTVRSSEPAGPGLGTP
jgi:hypothetical protein